MANINTRNVHRSNMLMGFPYGRDFVYDEMMLTGPGEQGEERVRRILPPTHPRRWSQSTEPGEGPSKRSGEPATTICCSSASPPTVVRYAPLHGDRDPGYGSTSKMISECAICLLRNASDVPAGIWTPGAAMQHKLIKRLVDHAGLTFSVEK